MVFSLSTSVQAPYSNIRLSINACGIMTIEVMTTNRLMIILVVISADLWPYVLVKRGTELSADHHLLGSGGGGGCWTDLGPGWSTAPMAELQTCPGAHAHVPSWWLGTWIVNGPCPVIPLPRSRQSVDQPVCTLTIIYDHELWVVTKRLTL